MALSPVEKMAHHPVGKRITIPYIGAVSAMASHSCGWRCKTASKWRAHGDAQEYGAYARTGLNFLLPERGKIVDVIAEIGSNPTVRVRQQPPGQPCPRWSMIGTSKPYMDPGQADQFGVFNVAFNTPRANHNHPVIFDIKTNETHRDAPDARKLHLPSRCRQKSVMAP